MYYIVQDHDEQRQATNLLISLETLGPLKYKDVWAITLLIFFHSSN